MTKADFIAGVAEVAGISKKDAGIALEAVLSQLTIAFSKVSNKPEMTLISSKDKRV